MPMLSVEVSEPVANELARQAAQLLLSRHAYLRAVLASVASQNERKPRGVDASRRRARRRVREKAETLTMQ